MFLKSIMKKMKNKYRKSICLLTSILLLSATALLAGCGGADPADTAVSNTETESEISEMKFREISEGQLNYEIPKKWKRISKEDESVVGNVTAYDTKEDCIVSFYTITWEQIKSSAFGEFYSTVDEYMTGEISSVRYSENVSDMSESEVTIDNQSAVVLEYSYTSAEDGSDKSHQKDVLFVYGDVFYRINISNLTDANTELIDSVIESITLN